MVTILINLLIVAVIVYICFWIIDAVPAPQPINIILKVIVAVLAIVKILPMLH